MPDLDLARRLCGSGVNVWIVNLEASTETVKYLYSTLSPEEQSRAENFSFDYLRERYCICRGLLRILLGSYLAVAPGDIRFAYGEYGKPSLCGSDSFQFNLAHADDLAAYAFALDCELGIDIERIRELENFGSVAKRFFCPEEVSDLESVDEAERLDSFFACWTRKEAYIKATGEGLSAALDSFRVALRPNEAASFIHIGGNTSEAQCWSLHNLRPNTEYIGALAFRGRRVPKLLYNQEVEDVLARLANPHRSIADCFEQVLANPEPPKYI